MSEIINIAFPKPHEEQHLTPAELVKRHIENKDDKITDEDIENLRLDTDGLHESHAQAALEGRIAEEAATLPDSEEQEEAAIAAEYAPFEDDTESHVSPWDLLK
ncbi:MAG: hypothetical protein ABIX01_10435 [Chitinophagaceae bacterium]